MVIAILAGLGLPKFREVVQKARIARAIGEISAIQWDLMALESQNQPLPATLAGVGRGGMRDPWSRPYEYFPFPAASRGNRNPPGARRDRFLVPVNSTFDLYSVGPDGQTALPFTAAASHDDIVRANDGGYIGLASGF
jgi:general secretion pathway protein G